MWHKTVNARGALAGTPSR